MNERAQLDGAKRRLLRAGVVGAAFAVAAAMAPLFGESAAEAPPSSGTASAPKAAEASSHGWGEPSPLPLPSGMPLADYERLLFEFLNERRYVELGWRADKGVRDTGPYRHGKSFGTHPAVRIYYSPEIIAWLVDGKRGAIPDGAMIVKEQFEEPAARYDQLSEADLLARMSSWTVMVKDAAGSHDGWFWSNPAKGQQVVDNHQYPFDHAISGFGIYCLRCHASTKTAGATNEYTFAALRNIAGFPGEPIRFEVDDSWQRLPEVEEPGEPSAADAASAGGAPGAGAGAQAGSGPGATIAGGHPRCSGAAHPELCTPRLNQKFLETFPSIAPLERSAVLRLPPVTHDNVVRAPAGQQVAQRFVTSSQCMSCHAGLLEPFGPTMFAPTSASTEYGAPGVHLSPYGEWRWTPMGLAGRDPVFYAQLESEIEMMRGDFADDPQRGEELAAELVATCLRCHGVMGKHQYEFDHGDRAGAFGLASVMHGADSAGVAAGGVDAIAGGVDHSRYGALARDGVSCAVCHQMVARQQPAEDPREYLEFFLETSTTGNFQLGPPGEIYGPFEDKELAPYAMEHAMGMKPRHNAYIQSSRMCASCHVVNLPIVDKPEPATAQSQLVAAEQNPRFREFHHHVEQATYLEWLNSEFENELNPGNPAAKTCQDCHMSRDYHNDQAPLHLDRIETQIAAIQDSTYPEAENLASRQELEIRVRKEGYARHNFRGLNMFLLEMFNQFDDLLGVRKFDYMTGSKADIRHAMADFQRQARNDVASLAVDAAVDDGTLTARVDVRNKVGHRFPSGVGFRRAFLELLVVEKPASAGELERIVWSSGRTNELGVLVDAAGAPLPCEFFADDPSTTKQSFQPHHEVITSPSQVQIYETLLWSAKHRFTTSFIHGSETVKDNRLLPRGWKKEGPGPALNGEFLRATWPCATAMKDPRYADGSGSDEVLYRVALPAGADASRLEVRATLYYQAMPPYFLRSLFETAPQGPATRRLHYMCSNLDLRGTAIEGWKLPVASAAAAVR